MKPESSQPLLTPADQERIEFLRHLDAAWFEVTEWEAKFIEDFLTRPRSMTPRQRASADELRQKYEARL